MERERPREHWTTVVDPSRPPPPCFTRDSRFSAVSFGVRSGFCYGLRVDRRRASRRHESRDLRGWSIDIPRGSGHLLSTFSRGGEERQARASLPATPGHQQGRTARHLSPGFRHTETVSFDSAINIDRGGVCRICDRRR